MPGPNASVARMIGNQVGQVIAGESARRELPPVRWRHDCVQTERKVRLGVAAYPDRPVAWVVGNEIRSHGACEATTDDGPSCCRVECASPRLDEASSRILEDEDAAIAGVVADEISPVVAAELASRERPSEEGVIVA